MAKGQRRIRPELWLVLIFLALLAYALIADWWKGHAVLGWVIVGIVVALLAFSLYRFPAFRGLLFRTAQKATEKIAYEPEVSGREPLRPELREHMLQRADYKCENPDCKEHVKPEIHHIDGNNGHNDPRNLIALCPNCHTKAHDGEYSNSQLRNWVRTSWETYKRGRRRFQA
jgi:hypothetical protein